MEKNLYDSIASVFPSDAHGQILSALHGVKRSAGILGIISVVGLLWSGTSLFASMGFALMQVFGTKQRDMHGFNSYGQQFALFFLLATWLTFMCVTRQVLTRISPHR